MLPKTRHFRRLAPTIFCALSYVVCFYALGQAMKLMTPGTERSPHNFPKA
ncbi:hypothetical protein L2W87_24840 [Citrobacter freundii]|nr:hypothetical protein [Citrobacter freundii]MDE9596045.1 hypothetical protein [Citrobacter freundii]